MPKPSMQEPPYIEDEALYRYLLELHSHVYGLGEDTTGELDEDNIASIIPDTETPQTITAEWTFEVHPLGLSHLQIDYIGTYTHEQIDSHLDDALTHFAKEAIELDDLGDVNAPSPTDNQPLLWDAATSRWIPKTVSVAKEIVFKAQGVAKGASAPIDALRDMGVSGDLKFPVAQFSKTTQQDVHGEFHLPDDIDDTEEIEFHLMWIPGSGWTTGNYVWKLEYLVKEEDDDTSVGTPITISMDVTPSNATDIIETEFTDTISARAQQIIFTHFYRDVANDNGNDTGDIIFFEVKYISNKRGESQ